MDITLSFKRHFHTIQPVFVSFSARANCTILTFTRTHTNTNGHKNINPYVHQREFWISIVCAIMCCAVLCCSLYVRAYIFWCLYASTVTSIVYHAPMVKIHIVAVRVRCECFVLPLLLAIHILAVFRRVAISLFVAHTHTFYLVHKHKHKRIFILIQCLLT